MNPLEMPDAHYLSAALGWLELGVPVEAEAELSRITASNQRHPDVLEVRWLGLANLQRWDAALAVARELVRAAPQRSSGWLHQAYALRRAEGGGLQPAWEALLPAYEKFPSEPTIPYNLSCYACQLHRLDDARDWFHRAIQRGGAEQLKEMALHDPDLRPLWAEIRKL